MIKRVAKWQPFCYYTYIEYKEGLIEKDKIKAKINGAGKIQYWKGVLSNV